MEKRKIVNQTIRDALENYVDANNGCQIEDAIDFACSVFSKKISRNVITGNISACCGYFQTLQYLGGCLRKV